MILSIFSILALVSALLVVRAKNPVHAVLFFILVFCNTSGLLILLGLDFFAMIFLVVYIGAIAVLFLFVVMMFHIHVAKEVLRYLPVSGIIGLILCILLLSGKEKMLFMAYTYQTTKELGFTNWEALVFILDNPSFFFPFCFLV
uniref:NADH-ubiquinone oxidoreductase chain 6 n=1 Tax=Pelargonium incrassatum TaxID=163034 RepID=A0A7U3SVK7_9ROSI|nr:NADH dehydrogenase subunit 6 [Pelargonium incrassatum]